jgi:pimeloyl-ACP methyl ester carboxylesterase
MKSTGDFHRGGDGEPLVLLHGFTDTRRTWTPIIPALERQHDVFAPTLPGHHGGPAFEVGADTKLDAIVDILERRLDAEGIETAHLVGNSLGGWLALVLAARGRARSVVALCPAGGWEHASREERAILRYFQMNERLLRHTPARVMREVAARPRLRALALRELVAHPERIDAQSAWHLMDGAARCTIVEDALAQTRAGEQFSDLEPIDVPIRIAYGTRDRIVRWPSRYKRMKRLLPDAEYVALEDMGHVPMWDDPAAVARVILEVTSPRASVTVAG